MDVDGIATAIAARYAPGAVTPPTGLANVRAATSDLPNVLSRLPIVLVFPDEGAFTTTAGGTRVGEHRFLVRFYLTRQRNLPRELNRARKWTTVLIDQLRTGMQLGGLATAARIVSWRIATLPYAGMDYTGVELACAVVTSESWTPTA